jgi:hypothetical protein
MKIQIDSITLLILSWLRTTACSVQHTPRRKIYALRFEGSHNRIYRLRDGAEASFVAENAYASIRAFWSGFEGIPKSTSGTHT